MLLIPVTYCLDDSQVEDLAKLARMMDALEPSSAPHSFEGVLQMIMLSGSAREISGKLETWIDVVGQQLHYRGIDFPEQG